jgi:hypothetical protein
MSKLIVSLVLAIGLNAQTFGQIYTPALFDSLCNETIQFYFSEISESLDSLKNPNYPLQIAYILRNDWTENLKTKFNKFDIQYVTEQAALEIISKTIKRKGVLNKISIKQYHDTIDIDIAGIVVTIKNVRFINNEPKDIEAFFEIGCGGGLGYIPTCRFIYDKKSNRWAKQTWIEIAEKKATSGY